MRSVEPKNGILLFVRVDFCLVVVGKFKTCVANLNSLLNLSPFKWLLKGLFRYTFALMKACFCKSAFCKNAHLKLFSLNATFAKRYFEKLA